MPGKQPSKQEVTQSTVEPTPILETSRAEVCHTKHNSDKTISQVISHKMLTIDL